MHKDEAGVRFEAERAELEVCVAAFKRLAVSATNAVVSAPDHDKRRELEKMEKEYSIL